MPSSPSGPRQPDHDPRLQAAWVAALARNGGEGPVTFALPGLDRVIRGVLDDLESLTDPTILDAVNEWLSALTRRGRLRSPIKIDAHGFNDTRGHKVSIQAVPDAPTLMTLFRDEWPVGYVRVFERLEALRRHLSLAVARELSAPLWVEQRQSVRAIRYLEGHHPPQALHEDPPIMALIVLPPADDRLIVHTEAGPQIVTAGPESTAVIIPGTRACQYIADVSAAPHEVTRLRTAPRDVITLFMGV